MAGSFKQGFMAGVPIMLGYFPVGITFGIVSVQAGLPVMGVALISAVMVSGASQFLFIAMLSTHMPLLMAFGLCLLLNARHVFYGALLSPLLDDNPRLRSLVAYALTDEVFAVAQSRLPDVERSDRIVWLAGLETAAWGMWVGSSALGALASGWLVNGPKPMLDAMQFALPALFFLLLIPSLNRTLSWGALVSFAVASCFTWYGQSAIGIVIAALAGAIICKGVQQWKPGH